MPEIAMSGGVAGASAIAPPDERLASVLVSPERAAMISKIPGVRIVGIQDQDALEQLVGLPAADPWATSCMASCMASEIPISLGGPSGSSVAASLCEDMLGNPAFALAHPGSVTSGYRYRDHLGFENKRNGNGCAHSSASIWKESAYGSSIWDRVRVHLDVLRGARLEADDSPASSRSRPLCSTERHFRPASPGSP